MALILGLTIVLITISPCPGPAAISGLEADRVLVQKQAHI